MLPTGRFRNSRRICSMVNVTRPFLIVLALLLMIPVATFADDLSDRLANLESAAVSAQSAADNSWVLLCSALVLLMTIPGLALFYGGLVRQKNVISTMLKSLICVGIATLMW